MLIIGDVQMVKKYALIGTGGRAEFFYGSVARDFKKTCELVAFCDLNQTRLDYANRLLEEKYDHHKIPTYLAHEFEEMIAQEKPDTIIVTRSEERRVGKECSVRRSRGADKKKR